MQKKFREIILNLFDGDAGTAGGANGANDNGGNTTGTEAKNAVSPEMAARGRSLGLPDDMLEDYQKAFGTRESNDETAQTDETEDNAAETDNSEELEKEFEELINGKYKDAYKSRMSSAVKDRVKSDNRERADMKAKISGASKVLTLLASKYKNVDPDNYDAIYNALKDDSDTWRQRSLDTGESVEQLKKDFDDKQQHKADMAELEMYRQQEKARALDMRLQSLAVKTKETYPDFNLQDEFENPKFRAALDYVAQQNSEKNKSSGRNDEIYDITFAYEMAHADELRKNTIQRTSKATANAVAQSIAANRNRARENAGSSSANVKPKGISEMSDEEFANLVNNVKSGKAKIPT